MIDGDLVFEKTSIGKCGFRKSPDIILILFGNERMTGIVVWRGEMDC